MLLPLIETVRRLVATVAALLGVWLILWSAGDLVVVRLVDFARDFETSPYFRAKDESLADFVRKRTSGRSAVVEDEDWKAFANTLKQGLEPGSLQRLSESSNRDEWVFEQDLLPRIPDGLVGDFVYLSIPSQAAWISLNRLPAQEIRGLDSSFVYPMRKQGLALFGIGFLFYLFLPLAKQPEGSLSYSRGAAVVGPDLLGLLGGSFFFALPLLILGENVPGQLPWSTEGGWHFLTLALWTMAALFLSLVAVGLFYAMLSVELTGNSLVVRKGFRRQEYAWSEMETCTDYRSQRGKLVGFLLIVLANSPGMVGQGLLVASNEERGLEIRMKDGRSLRVMANSFPGYESVVEALRERRISGADTLET